MAIEGVTPVLNVSDVPRSLIELLPLLIPRVTDSDRK